MPTYREYLYGICRDANLKDEEEVIMLIRFLAKECLQYHDLAMAQEKKLKEVMSYTDFTEWATKNAKEIFKNEVYGMEDGEFKDFCLENLDMIIGAEE